MSEENDGKVDFWENQWAAYKSADDIKTNYLNKSLWFNETFTDILPKRLQGARVLDFGCGIGYYAFPLCQRFHSYTGLDVSHSAIATANTFSVFNAVSEVATFEVIEPLKKLMFPGNYFDCVFTCTVLQHQPEWKKIVPELVRVLKTGGIYVGFEWPKFWNAEEFESSWGTVKVKRIAQDPKPHEDLWYGIKE
jgi:ubiquinone/menaquinone biosynthesis C-methylase UbiE